MAILMATEGKGNMTTSPRDLKYGASLIWDMESGGEVRIGKVHALKLGMDVEFGGKGRYPCPDELFLSALGGCLLTTFLWFKKRLKFNLEGLRISVEGTVSHVGPRGYRVTGIEAIINVETDEEGREKAQKCAELTQEYCHLTRSIDSAIPIKVSAEIQTRKSKPS